MLESVSDRGNSSNALAFSAELRGDYGIHHIAHSPKTGVWAVIKNLAAWQEQLRPGSVTLTVVADSHWMHMDEFKSVGFRTRLIRIPALPHGCQIPYLLATMVWRKVKDGIEPRGISHYHNAWMSSALMGPKPEGPAVVTVHGIPTDEYFHGRAGRAALHSFLARRTLRSRASMVSVDWDSAEKFPRLFGTDPVSFAVIPNGIRDPGIIGCPRLRGQDVFTVGFLGTLDANKGWDIICSAVKVLGQRGHKVRILVGGIGPRQAQDAVRQACDSIGNGSAFYGWVKNPFDNFIPSLDAFVIASRAEGAPLTALECLGASVPLICTRVGILGYLLKDGHDCIFVERNETSIAEAVARLLQDSELHASMARNARDTFERWGSLDQLGRKYFELYDATIARWTENRARLATV